MIEKCIIYVSYSVYAILIHDMYVFECFGKKGEVNQNRFLNVIIANFYLGRLEKREMMKKQFDLKALPDTLSKNSKEKIIDECVRIMNDVYYEDTNRFHEYSFSFYPTKQTEAIINQMFEDEINGKRDKSVFFRGILNEYASLPQYLRERVLKRYELHILYECIEEHREAVFKLGPVEKHILPFIIMPSDSENFDYLLGHEVLPNGEKAIFSIRICKIWTPVKGRKFKKFSKKEIDRFTDILHNGIEFATGKIIKAKVQFTDQGAKRFNYSYVGKPHFKIIDSEKRIASIDCTLPNFIEYFRPFLKDAVVLDNEELRQKMEKLYREGADTYKNIKEE